MKLPVLQYPDPRLKEKSAPVTKIDDEIKKLAADMIETMYAEEGIGLAAPQVDRRIRMAVIDLSGPSKREGATVYINPVLELFDDEKVVSEEGCLSVPDFKANVKRAAKVRITALGLDGKEFSHEADEVEAICLQHECDHLDGVLFVDHLSCLKRKLYNDKIKKRLKEASGR
jgi:peptide deformylase